LLAAVGATAITGVATWANGWPGWKHLTAGWTLCFTAALGVAWLLP
jgi:hypothetical protein